MCTTTNRTSLIVPFEPRLTLALLPVVYAPEEFVYQDKVYREAHGAGSVFLDWLVATDNQLIGIQFDTDLLELDGYGRSKLTEEGIQQRMHEAERNLGRDYMTRLEHHVQVWFGRRRDFDPERSCHQYLVYCDYISDSCDW